MHGRNTVRTDKERERKKKQVTNRCFKPPNEDKCFIISASVTKSDTLQTSINMKYQACCHINDGGASRVHQPSAKTYRSHAIMRRLLLLWQSSVITAMRSKTSVHGLWRLPPFYFDIPLIYDSSCRQTERDRERERTRGVMPREREREIGRCGYSWPERGVPTISTTTLAGPEEEIGSVFFYGREGMDGPASDASRESALLCHLLVVPEESEGSARFGGGFQEGRSRRARWRGRRWRRNNHRSSHFRLAVTARRSIGSPPFFQLPLELESTKIEDIRFLPARWGEFRWSGWSRRFTPQFQLRRFTTEFSQTDGFVVG